MSMTETDDVMADVKAAMNPVVDEPVVDDPIEEPAEEKPVRDRDESGKFKAKEEENPVEPEAPVIEPQRSKIEPPISMPSAIKAKWETLPPEVQEYWANRESDIHKNMTAQDGELRIGREMKEVIAPYTPMLQAANIQPKELVSDLMNKVYILNTGHPQQKAALIHSIAKQYGVDLSQAQPQQVDPNLSYFQSQIQQLQQQANPEVIKNQLREEMERDRVANEIVAFSRDPKNVYFEEVKTLMGSLMASEQAKTLQDAYDQACYANPVIRSTLLKAQADQDAAKRKAENDAKRKAGASVNGSPSGASPAPKAPNNSIEDDIRLAIAEASGVV